MRRVRVAAGAAATVAVLAGSAWALRADGTGAQRARFDLLPTYPGADEPVTERYPLDDGGLPFGADGLRLRYRLPAGTSVGEVLAFYREAVPPGWTLATDETCREVNRVTTPPPSITGPGATVTTPPDPQRYTLLDQARSLTMLAPGAAGLGAGVTVRLESTGDGLTVVLDRASIACGAPGSDPAPR